MALGGGGGGGRTSTTSATTAIALHLIFSLTLASSYFLIARNLYNFDLVTHPVQTLRILTIVQAPVVIGSFSWLRRDPQRCSFWWAAGRGLAGIQYGAMLNIFGAIILGAPVQTKYSRKTIYWSFLMSFFTFVPAFCVFGSSRKDWQRLLSHSKPADNVEYMITLPAHGAIVGAWLGAWPMPLDWERPWQEWPICVTYGAVAGYFVGLLASSICILLHWRRSIRAKAD